MKILVIGAGVTGSYYAYMLKKNNYDVDILARNQRYQYLKRNGLSIVNVKNKDEYHTEINVINKIPQDIHYDFVLVFVGYNNMETVCGDLEKRNNIDSICFFGNNTSGFSKFAKFSNYNNLLLSFPMVAGEIIDNVVHVNRNNKIIPYEFKTVVGATSTNNTKKNELANILRDSGLRGQAHNDIDGWLKYHFAFVSPILLLLYKHDYSLDALVNCSESLRQFIMSCREMGDVLKQVGFKKRYPFKFNLFYLPIGFLSKMLAKQINTEDFRYAFFTHARSASSEFSDLVKDFRALKAKTNIETPVFDGLCKYIK